jgi:hypothetical protein
MSCFRSRWPTFVLPNTWHISQPALQKREILLIRTLKCGSWRFCNRAWSDKTLVLHRHVPVMPWCAKAGDDHSTPGPLCCAAIAVGVSCFVAWLVRKRAPRCTSLKITRSWFSRPSDNGGKSKDDHAKRHDSEPKNRFPVAWNVRQGGMRVTRVVADLLSRR